MNLIHVGFLGAAAPAVSGLKEIAFSEEPEGTVIEYALADRRMTDLRQKLRTGCC